MKDRPPPADKILQQVLGNAETGLFPQHRFRRLSDLLALIKSAIDVAFDEACWVVAEIAEMRLHQKGHCYLGLVEKQEDRTVAQVRATIWSYAYRSLTTRFERATGDALKPGMKVLLLAEVSFHQVHGLSLNIRDLDPAYTMGEMARKKRETIERLVREGIIGRNKGLDLPLVPQRIAVVSSPAAAGYGDFVNHLRNNPYGYSFSHRLFSAAMQGAEAEESIKSALRRAASGAAVYDIAVIIRGGGSQVDLSCFDSYGLAAEVARFPLPVLTGIGHERDDTVLDIVAHTKCKTPTDVAQFLISGARSYEERLLNGQARVAVSAERCLKEQGHRIAAVLREFRHRAVQALGVPRGRLDMALFRVSRASGTLMLKKREGLRSLRTVLERAVGQVVPRQGAMLSHLEQAVRHLDPVHVLKRGYSITSLGGRALVSAEGIEKGALVQTVLCKGWIRSRVEGAGDGETGGRVQGSD